MAWSSLGSIALTEDWRSFPLDVVNATTIKLVQTTIADPFINSFWLSRFFATPSPGGRLIPWVRVHSASESVIIDLPFPEGYLEQGIFIYTLQARLKYPYYPTPWTVEAFALT
jgi:hypothetical protein